MDKNFQEIVIKWKRMNALASPYWICRIINYTPTIQNGKILVRIEKVKKKLLSLNLKNMFNRLSWPEENEYLIGPMIGSIFVLLERVMKIPSEIILRNMRREMTRRFHMKIAIEVRKSKPLWAKWKPHQARHHKSNFVSLNRTTVRVN